MESVIMPSSLIAPRVQIGSSFQNLLGSQPLTQEVTTGGGGGGV